MHTELLPTLLLIDIQQGLDEWTYYGTERNNPHAEKNTGQLLAHWRKNKGLIIHVKHNSTNPNSPLYPTKSGNQIKEEVAPIKGESVLTKQVNSAFIGTPLQQILEDNNVGEIVIAGLTAEHCISTSVRMAANMGYEVTLVMDATAAFDKTTVKGDKISAKDVYNVTLANLEGEFCKLATTKEIIQS